MKLAVISDIHIDEQEDELQFEELLASCVNASHADYLLVAGDISEHYERSLDFMDRLSKKIRMKAYFCFGNHDLWSKHEAGLNVSTILARAKSRGKGFMQNEAVFLDSKTVLIAGCGWYDYSFAFPGMFTKEELSGKEYMGRTWQDSLYALHGKSDEEVCKEWNSELLNLAESHVDKNIVFMTHMVNHPAFLVGEDHKKYEMFKYFNSFLGSEGLYNISRHKSIKTAISGHVHYRKSFIENGTLYLCRCLGYPAEFPAFGGKSRLEDQITSAIETIEIN